MAEDTKVTFGASAGQLLDTIDQVKGKFADLTESIGKVKDAFLGISVVLAGGSLFKNAIQGTEELIDATRRLMSQTGMSALEAQTMAETLKRSDSSSQAYTQTLMRLQMRLNTNEAAFKSYGIATRDASGALLPAETIFRNTITSLEGLEAGSNRNSASLQLLGRSARDIEPFMRAMRVNQADLSKEMMALGLVIDHNEIGMKDRYTDAMSRVELVTKALGKAVADEAIPGLTEMANTFANLGPDFVDGATYALKRFHDELSTVATDGKASANSISTSLHDIAQSALEVFDEGGEVPRGMKLFKNMIDVIAIGIEYLALTFRMLKEEIEYWYNSAENATTSFIESMQSMGAAISTIFDTIGLAMTGKISLGDAIERIKNSADATVGAAQTGNKLRETEEARHAAAMLDMRTNFLKKWDDLTGTADAKASTYHASDNYGDTEGMKGGGKAHVENAGKMASALAAIQKAESQARLAIEKEADAEQLAEIENLYKHAAITVHEYYEEKTAIALKQNQEELDAANKQWDDLEAARGKVGGKTADEERAKIEAEQAKIVGQIVVLEEKRGEIVRTNSRAEEDAAQKLQDMRDAAASASSGQAGMAQIAVEEAALKQREALERVSAEETLAIRTNLENRSMAITMEGLNQRLIAAHNDEKEQLKIYGEMEKAQQDHEAKLTQLTYAAELQRSQLALQFNKTYQSSLSTLLVDSMQHVKSLQDIFHTFFVSVATGFENMIAQKFVERLFGAGSVGGGFIDSLIKPVLDGIDSMASSFLEMIGVTVPAQKAAGASGAAAFAGGYAVAAMESVAAIPFVGWSMAPEVGAAAYTLGLSYAGLASAEQGYWHLPSDQLVAMHKNEMAIPAAESQGLRDLIENNKTGGGGGDIHIHTMDAAGVQQFVRRHGDAFSAGLRTHILKNNVR